MKCRLTVNTASGEHDQDIEFPLAEVKVWLDWNFPGWESFVLVGSSEKPKES